jgi:BlaI family transcriptional regulator, penicillinase repressor
MTKPHTTLTPQELAIMKVVWRKEEATVRDVYEALQKSRPVAYTTVMTMMRILQEKGFLTKVAEERAHVYTPSRPRQQVLGAMVRDFVDRVFDGASEGLLLHLAKDNTLTAKQKKLLTELVDDSEKDDREKK